LGKKVIREPMDVMTAMRELSGAKAGKRAPVRPKYETGAPAVASITATPPWAKNVILPLSAA
jgi:hypothetical protein